MGTKISRRHFFLTKWIWRFAFFLDSNWRIRDILGHIATSDRTLANALKAYIDSSQSVVMDDWDKEDEKVSAPWMLFCRRSGVGG